MAALKFTEKIVCACIAISLICIAIGFALFVLGRDDHNITIFAMFVLAVAWYLEVVVLEQRK